LHKNLCDRECTRRLTFAGLTLELELALAIKCGALTRGVACLSALLAGCTDQSLLTLYSAWRNRDINPDSDELAEELKNEEATLKEKEAGVTVAAPAQTNAENTNV
jgi:hypothetical protein